MESIKSTLSESMLKTGTPTPTETISHLSTDGELSLPIAKARGFPLVSVDKSGVECASQFCNASRYWLIKNGYYPKTKLGDAKLASSIERSQTLFDAIKYHYPISSRKGIDNGG